MSFVGAGPGASDLITLRGAKRLGEANVIIWASSLVPESLLEHRSKNAQVYDSAGMTLEDVLKIYESHQSSRIVRLHSGDPSIYGAMQEQIDWCIQNERDFEIVPGVTSVSASAAILGKELTIPGLSQSVVMTRLATRTKASMPETEDIATFASTGATMAVFLSAARPVALQEKLLNPPSIYDQDSPAAVIYRATWPDEKFVLTSVGKLAETIKDMGATTTVLVIVGDVLSQISEKRSHLYNPQFAHRYRKRSTPGTVAGVPTGIPAGQGVNES
ncbi:MAG: precorrin-4 C(11)-methyltransferase [Acidimicrobiales bacterium]|nr:precorrin-4 C(11)-methyltransferase [Acidimicrobiales bacterium]